MTKPKTTGRQAATNANAVTFNRPEPHKLEEVLRLHKFRSAYRLLGNDRGVKPLWA